MSLLRNELRTGLLVVVTVGLVAAVLIYYGAAGDFRDRKRFQIYFDDAGGIQQGATVTLAGRKVGQVRRLISPVPEAERPRPELEVIIEVEVSITARIYREQRVLMLQYGMLGDQLIDFTGGVEASGVAPDGSTFIGKRQPGLNDAVPAVLERIDPLVKEATALVQELQKTAKHLGELTAGDSSLNKAITEYRQAGENLAKMTGPDGSVTATLKNLQEITGPEGEARTALRHLEKMTGEKSDLAAALRNVRDFTGNLSANKDLPATLANFRRASEQLNATVGGLSGTVEGLSPCLDATVKNAAQFTDTIKRQPWRLIWPSTKKYPEDEAQQYLVTTTEEIVQPIAEGPPKRRRLWAEPPKRPDPVKEKTKAEESEGGKTPPRSDASPTPRKERPPRKR